MALLPPGNFEVKQSSLLEKYGPEMQTPLAVRPGALVIAKLVLQDYLVTRSHPSRTASLNFSQLDCG